MSRFHSLRLRVDINYSYVFVTLVKLLRDNQIKEFEELLRAVSLRATVRLKVNPVDGLCWVTFDPTYLECITCTRNQRYFEMKYLVIISRGK